MKTYEELMYELEERKAMSILQRRKMGIRMRKMMKNPAVQERKRRLLQIQKFYNVQIKLQNKLLLRSLLVYNQMNMQIYL